MFKQITTSFNKGFTLVETLVAISILVIALTGPLAIIAQSLKSSYFARDEITAAYLAQEPIEFIRNIRDQNSLQSSNSGSWLTGVTPTPGSPTNLTVDANGNGLINNAGQNLNPVKAKLIWHVNHYALQMCQPDCRVTYNPNAAVGEVIYGSDANGLPDSIYTRDIYLSNADYLGANVPGRELVITVVVSWNTGGISHNVTVVERLFNWQLENE